LLGPNPITKRGVCVPGEAQKQKFLDANVGGAKSLTSPSIWRRA